MTAHEQLLQYLGDVIEFRIRSAFNGAYKERCKISILIYDPNDTNGDLLITNSEISALREMLGRAEQLDEIREKGYPDALAR